MIKSKAKVAEVLNDCRAFTLRALRRETYAEADVVALAAELQAAIAAYAEAKGFRSSSVQARYSIPEIYAADAKAPHDAETIRRWLASNGKVPLPFGASPPPAGWACYEGSWS